MTTTPPPLDDREKVARALALTDDYDGCFERLDGTDPDGEEPMHSDAEDAEWWRRRADAVLAVLDLPARDNAVARDALDGLAEQHTRDANVPGIPDPIRRGLLLMADEARAFRDRTYPTPKEN